MASAAGFVKEHRNNAERWNLESVYRDYLKPRGGATMQIVGSDQDQFEHRQIDMAKIRLKQFYPAVQVERIQGAGHWVMAEKPPVVVEMIENLATKRTFATTSTVRRPWSSVY